MAVQTVAEVLDGFSEDRGELIPILQEVQEVDGFLSPEALEAIATKLEISENEIYGVASFYAQFRFEPPAEHTISVCQGTACHVRGGNKLLQNFEELLEVEAPGMTDDAQVGLERVACVGCCALAPVVVVDGEVKAEVKPRMVRRMVGSLSNGQVAGKEARAT